MLRPWHLRWGAEPEDAERELPSDELLPDGGTRILHAVTIDPPAEENWPWLAQLGQDRGRFYSYEWLENLAGCEMNAADRIHSEWQHRKLAETVHLHAAGGLRVTVFEPGRALGLAGWGRSALVPVGARRTRLISRGDVARWRRRRGVCRADGYPALPDGATDAARTRVARRTQPTVIGLLSALAY